MDAMKNRRITQLGFTLIELLVVFAILGILATIGIGSYMSSQMKSRDSHRKTDLKNIAIVLETFYNDAQAYPTSSAGEILGCGAGGDTACAWGAAWAGNGVTYMSILPDDISANDYFYHSEDGTSYELYARLENTADQKAIKTDEGAAAGYEDMICSGTTVRCNFVVASANAELPTVIADGEEE